MRKTLLNLVLLTLLAPSSRAADVWTLTSADLTTTAVLLKSAGPAGLRVANVDGGNERAVPLGDFVSLDRQLPPAAAPGGYVLYLTSGDKIAGEPAGVKGESIVWKHPAVGELNVPLRQIRGLAEAGVKVPDEQRKEDVVTLANKDIVRGTIAGLTADKVTLQTEAGASDIPLNTIESLAFATILPAGGNKASPPAYRVRLDDGSSLVGSTIEVAGDKLKLTIGGTGNAANGANAGRPIDLARVTEIEQVNGPVSWLSSRAPAESVYTPYLGSGQRYPAKMNANVVGDPIRFKDKVYPRGIGVHSYSRLVFPLDGAAYKAFRTRYAIDPSAETDRADVTVRIRLDDKVAHEQQHVRPGVLSPPVVLDLGDAKALTLEVDYGDNIDSGDRLNWIEPALMKVKPATEALPATAPATGPATKPATDATAQPTDVR